jgi:hypothetical protein
MTDINESMNFPGEKKPLPTGINVLTILTFIGSAVALLSSIWQFINAKKSVDQLEATINSDKFDDMPGFLKGMMTPEMLEMARKQYENRIPILAIGLVSLALCVYGAMQMRQLKGQGYLIYVIGELLPLVAIFLFIGMGALKGFGLIGVIIPVLFIILYTMQRKHLKS